MFFIAAFHTQKKQLLKPDEELLHQLLCSGDAMFFNPERSYIHLFQLIPSDKKIKPQELLFPAA